MPFFRFPYSIPGQWISTLAIVGLIIMPFGCQTVQILDGPNGNPFGVIVNTDTSRPVLGGVRVQSGEEVYLYGNFTPQGAIANITGAAFVNKDGDEASLVLEDGLPVYAVGFDGSSIDLVYQEVSFERVAGSAEMYFAETGETESLTFDVDLLLAAAELAELVLDLTGLQISDEEPPDSAKAATIADSGKSDATADKPSGDAEQNIIIINLFPPAFSLTGFTIVNVMAQLLEVTLFTFVNVIGLLTRTIIIAVFTPFLLLGNLLRAASGLPTLALDFSLSLDFMLRVPGRPHR